MPRSLIAAYRARLPLGPADAQLLHRTPDERIVGLYRAARLTSVFQPVADRAGAVVGQVGYVRCEGDGAVDLSPWQLFALAASGDELVRLDRLCRTVHALNYFGVDERGRRLHLLVEHRLLTTVPDDHGRAFERVLASFEVKTSRVVIELPAEASGNAGLLAHVIANYRYHGYAVAARALPGKLETVAALRPDVVRLDPRDHRDGELVKAIELARHFGARALVERVESREGLERALEAGADLVQGVAVGVPAPEPAWRPLADAFQDPKAAAASTGTVAASLAQS
jgi:EAL domain-containing protein (putative c-di-GMP-specific phosphodiesterase class I)